jgi:hypothetical protein
VLYVRIESDIINIRSVIVFVLVLERAQGSGAYVGLVIGSLAGLGLPAKRVHRQQLV